MFLIRPAIKTLFVLKLNLILETGAIIIMFAQILFR